MTHKTLDIITKQSPHLEWMKDNTIFLALHGSRSYNTHIEGSDEDFKGVAIPPHKYLYGFHHVFEQAILKDPDPDTTIFSIQKFFSLAAVCNPNVLEVLFTDPSDHVLVTPIGEQLLDNKKLFLSKRIKHTMCGYAYDQMRRIERHRRWMFQPYKELPTRESLGLPEKPEIKKEQFDAASANIQKQLEQYNFDFLDDCPEPTKIAIRNAWHDMLVELDITTDERWLAASRQIGLTDNFIEIMQRERFYRNQQEDFKKYLKWVAKRNPERHALEEKFGYDTKHGYHLVRLITMCEEALTIGDLIVKRIADRERYIDIRNGKMPFEELKEFLITKEQKLQELYHSTTILPRQPNINALDKLCISLVEQGLLRGCK